LVETIHEFIDQEAGHSREHIVMNKCLTNAGYDVAALDTAIRTLVHRLDGLDDVTKLTATVCIEHLTAIVAAEVLANNHLLGSDAELQEIWNWHCLEEVEHKGVAFDVWLHATRHWSGMRRWIMRSSIMIVITASFIINRLRGQIALLRQDGIGTWAALSGALRYGFGRGGIGRKVLAPWFAFLKPGFHPWDIDNRALLAKAEEDLAQSVANRTRAAEPTERRKTPRLKKAA
jgi:predicted metal-dependent hydrolase